MDGGLMSRLVSIGEVLIDFMPQEKGCALKDVVHFEKAPGGAPANVAAAVAKYGHEAIMLTKLGVDAFGDFLIETLKNAGVNTEYILRTDKANTGLAFVSLREDGERDFSFYRKPSADLLLEPEEVTEAMFEAGDFLHFCSVDLVESPMKEAHRRAIALVKEKQGLISFDPNVRLPLWDSPEKCREAIREFLPYANLVKVSDEELPFITGIEDEQEALKQLFVGDVKVVVYTKGAEGALVVTKDHQWYKEGFTVQVEDTTGAGDAFIGGFLAGLMQEGATVGNLTSVIAEKAEALLTFANASGALTTTKKGAISALPTPKEIEALRHA